MTTTPEIARRIRRTALVCTGVAASMTGLAFASAPLYDLFCKVTGFGGTPMVGTSAPGEILDRTVTVRFDANVAPTLPWRFQAETPAVDVRIGEAATVRYTVRNAGPAPATGVATFNVQPELAGAYFTKIQCFCFQEQTLQAGESTESAVVFYVDPAIVKDPNLAGVQSITLSYTYFPAKGTKPAATLAEAKPKP